ncbi:MAG TPA: aldehyde dehydrogenase family protein [Actinomycetales bacterium]|nr:aldehyde dehydrogenase family protein [Actinomycetales bacterium]
MTQTVDRTSTTELRVTRQTRHHVGGWRDGAGQRQVVVRDPATGTATCTMVPATDAEVDEAVRLARTTSPTWQRTSPAERAAVVRAAAQRVRDCADELTALTTSEMGRPADLARGGVDAGASTMEQYAELGPLHRGRSLQGGWDAVDLMVPQARGVVAVCTPWNDPVAVPAGLLAAALVTGNTVVFKPSERTPLTGERLAQTFLDELPEGVLTLVHGDAETGAALSGHDDVDVVCHVGSTAAGRAIAAAVAQTGAKALLENGGKDPMIVDAGVDPVWAAQQAALGGFINSGQLCTAVERVYVHEHVADAFVEALVREAKATQLGPMVDERMRTAVHQQVHQALESGARAVVGGSVPEGPGAYYPATVLTGVTPDMSVMRDETFGPVVPVMTVGSFGEALELACDSPYGLAATVLTPSMANAQRAWRELPVGTVKVNAVFGGAPGGAAQPRGASGDGFGYGPELLDELTVTKVVHLGQAPLAQ